MEESGANGKHIREGLHVVELYILMQKKRLIHQTILF